MQRPCAAAPVCQRSLGDPSRRAEHRIIFEFVTRVAGMIASIDPQSIGHHGAMDLSSDRCHLCLVNYPRRPQEAKMCSVPCWMAQRRLRHCDGKFGPPLLPGELPCSRKCADRQGPRRLTADGYAGFKPPDNGCGVIGCSEPLAVTAGVSVMDTRGHYSRRNCSAC
jgi:hypothetical protein